MTKLGRGTQLFLHACVLILWPRIQKGHSEDSLGLSNDGAGASEGGVGT